MVQKIVAVNILEVSLPCVSDVFDADVVALVSSTENAMADNEIATSRDSVTDSIAQWGVEGAAHNAAECLNTNAHIRAAAAGNVPERLIPKGVVRIRAIGVEIGLITDGRVVDTSDPTMIAW